MGSGGRYIGFCLGAYFAGSDPGFELLPSGIDTDQYITSHGASVKHDKDTIVQVDWLSGAPAQQSPFFGAGRWLFFQDGPLIDVSEASLPAGAKVLGRYRSNGALAAVLSPYGKGWVGVIGPHPEADQSWCKCDQDYNVINPSTDQPPIYFIYSDDDIPGLHNPDGIQFDIGHAFVEAVANAGN